MRSPWVSAQLLVSHPKRLVSCDATQSVESACLLLPLLLLCCMTPSTSCASGNSSACGSSVLGLYDRTTVFWSV